MESRLSGEQARSGQERKKSHIIKARIYSNFATSPRSKLPTFKTSLLKLINVCTAKAEEFDNDNVIIAQILLFSCVEHLQKRVKTNEIGAVWITLLNIMIRFRLAV